MSTRYRSDDMDKSFAEIRTLGDPVLRERAKLVQEFDERLARLAALMTETMDREEGVGLAATQLGILARLIVWRHPDEEDEVRVFANPEVVERSESCTVASEGCLSVPGASVDVSRSDEVLVTGFDLEGGTIEVRLHGLAARIVQHEIDHLDGQLILDRTSPEERRRAFKEMRERAAAAQK
jgi:peptide deformylase